eukprot:2332922-Alexandrium_andersonii.AAC.1
MAFLAATAWALLVGLASSGLSDSRSAGRLGEEDSPPSKHWSPQLWASWESQRLRPPPTGHLSRAGPCPPPGTRSPPAPRPRRLRR